MAVWVVANMHYSRVLKQIAPLEGALAALRGQLADSQARLQQCQGELAGLDDQVRALRAGGGTPMKLSFGSPAGTGMLSYSGHWR
jgi:hypothetical protein